MDVNTSENMQLNVNNSLKTSQIIIQENPVNKNGFEGSSKTPIIQKGAQSDRVANANDTKSKKIQEVPKINERILEQKEAKSSGVLDNKADCIQKTNQNIDYAQNRAQPVYQQNNQNRNNERRVQNEHIAADLNKPYAYSSDGNFNHNQADQRNKPKGKLLRNSIKKNTCGKCLVF